MRILYGVQGTGNGHITRARVMAAEFARRRLEVDFIFSGRAPSAYFDMAAFGDFATRPGLTFVTERGRISVGKTLRHSRPLQLLRDIRRLQITNYDLLINDFEPVSAWAARRAGVPSVGISHQAAFLNPIPKAGETAVARRIIRHFAPTQQPLGVHWYHFGRPLLPPLIETHPAAPSDAGRHILVYLPFESPEEIAALLHPFGDTRFHCYHPGAVTAPQAPHIHWRPPSRDGFQRDLQQASGVIANGGFELPSEALALGKKLLLKPVLGQFEQQSNVLTLQQMKLARVMYRLERQAVADWLSLPPAQPVHYPEVAAPLVDWLLAGDWRDPAPLCDRLWAQVRFPSYCTLPGN